MVTYTVNINGILYSEDWYTISVTRTSGQMYEAELYFPSLKQIDDGNNIIVDNLVKIYRDGMQIIKGVIRIIDLGDNDDATIHVNDTSVRLFDAMVMERRDYINKEPNEIYCGYRDNIITAQPNSSSTYLKIASTSDQDSRRVRFFGRDVDSNWRDETVVMNGSDNATTSLNFQMLAYASLVNSAKGTVTIKDSLDNTLGIFLTTNYTIADEDDFGHYGNGYLYFPENNSNDKFYGFATNIDTTVAPITTRNEFDNRLLASARVANQTNYEWWIDEDTNNDKLYDSG